MQANESIQLYFMHGWACNGNIWQKWLLPRNNISYHIFNRGYFGDEKNTVHIERTTAKNVLIAHSLGIHFVPLESLAAIDILVLISSFSFFHEESVHGRLSAKRTKLMKERLIEDPGALLKDFYLKCGLHTLQFPRIANIDSQLLYDDLVLVDTSHLELSSLEQIPKIILLHGARDQIVNCEHSQLMHKLLPNSQVFISEQGQHALPITESEWCMQYVF